MARRFDFQVTASASARRPRGRRCWPPVSRRLTGRFTGLQDGCVHFYFLYFVMVTEPQPVFYRLYTSASRKTLELLLCSYNFIIAYVSSVQTSSWPAPVENKANIVRTANSQICAIGEICGAWGLRLSRAVTLLPGSAYDLCGASADRRL